MANMILSEIQTLQNGAKGFREAGTGAIVVDEGRWDTLQEDAREITMPQGLAEHVYGLLHEYGDFNKARDYLKSWHEREHVLGGSLTMLREDVTSDELSTILDGSIRTHIMDYWTEEPWPWLEVVDVVGYPDFETQKLVTLGDGTIVFSGSSGSVTGTRSDGILPEVFEGIGYNEMRLSEKYETNIVRDYGAVISITERSLKADSKNVLVKLPQSLGTTAKLTVSNSVQNILTQSTEAGPTMTEDSAAAMSSTRGNLGTSALTLATINTGIAAMAGMKSFNGGSAGRVLGNIPKWLVVPAANKIVADALVGPLNTTLIVGTTAATSSSYSPAAAMLTVSCWPAISDSSCWFLLTDKTRFPHIQVAFLDGRQEPIIEVQGGMMADLSSAIGRKYRVRAPHGVGLTDWRGLYGSTT